MRLTIRLLSSVIQRRPFYVTTPIFYVNAAPHLGHLYSAVVADAIARFEKLVNPDCNIILGTGTDEHGTKIQQAAEKASLSLHKYCSTISDDYRQLFKEFDVDYTDFIRTTEERHEKAVRHFWKKLTKKQYIYKAQYSGWYSVNDEAFVPESHVRDAARGGETVKVSVESGHQVQWTEETNYMFRLSAFKTHLQEWLKNVETMGPWSEDAKSFIKDLAAKLREATGDPLSKEYLVQRISLAIQRGNAASVLDTMGPSLNYGVITPHKFQRQLQEWLDNESYFPDISVSRPASRVHWAIRVPGDEEQSIYVWLDALVSYLTSIGFPDEDAMKARGRPWPADVQVLGKDILKFHGIYWPAFLMAVNWPPPRRLVCHSHWTVDGSKMSKSLGNVVCPRAAPAAHCALRYVLLREGTMVDDANYSETKLINIANSELADTLGNLASRCCGAALNPRGEFPKLHAPELAQCRSSSVANALLERVERLHEICHEHYTNYQFYKAVDAVIQTLHLANLFFESHAPWELRKKVEQQAQLDVILHITMETLRICGIILQPIVPELSEKLLDKLQIGKDCRSWQHCEMPSWTEKGAIYETKYIQSGKFVLFQRIYTDKKEQKKAKA